MKQLFNLSFLMLFAMTSLSAQKHEKGHQGPPHKIERLQSFLNLSDKQVNLLKTEIETLKQDETLGKREMFHQALASVLSPKQMDKFQSRKAWKEHNQPHKPHWLVPDGAMKAKLLEMRKEFDEVISEEDKVLIEELRNAKQELHRSCLISKNTFKERRDEEVEKIESQWQRYRSESRPQLEKARALDKKYFQELIELFQENDDFFIKHKVAERHLKPEGLDCKECCKVPFESEELARKYALFKRIAFILMPTSEVPDFEKITADLPNELVIYPNPTVHQTTLSYLIETPADVTIELRDEQGQLMKTIMNRQHDKGSYLEALNTSDLPSGIYLISFRAGDSYHTKKLIVQH